MNINRIMELAHEISTTTKTDVFLNYYPHCQCLDVRIFLNGWQEDKDPDIKETIYCDGELYEQDFLENMVNKLEGMLKK